MKFSRINMLIFEKSFLLKQGIISILNEFNNCGLSEDYNNGHLFHSAVKLHQPQIVFIGSDILAEISDMVVKSLKREYHFVLIALCVKAEPGTNENIDHIIDYSADRATIIDSINKAVEVFVPDKSKKKPDNQLSDREKDIVTLVAKGLTNKEIAGQLFISIHTVITHRKNIGRKLGIKSVSGITVYAILNKLIEMKDL